MVFRHEACCSSFQLQFLSQYAKGQSPATRVIQKLFILGINRVPCLNTDFGVLGRMPPPPPHVDGSAALLAAFGSDTFASGFLHLFYYAFTFELEKLFKL